MSQKKVQYKAVRMGLSAEELEQRLKLSGVTIDEVIGWRIPNLHAAELLEEMAYSPINTPMMTKYSDLLEERRLGKLLVALCRQIGLKEKELLEVMEMLELDLSHVEARLADYKALGWEPYRLGSDLLAAAFDLDYELPTARDGWAELLGDTPDE